MDKDSPAPQEIMVDKDRFDAVLRKIISAKPLQLKEAIGTSKLRRGRKSKPSSD
jgi:hypothetical protein